jgi:hypothetical protein
MTPSAKLRDVNSIMAGWVDRGPWLYWDHVRGTQGTALLTNYSVYSNPIGTIDPVTTLQKTKLDTNMTRGNQFPPPRCLVLNQLGFYFSSAMLKADIDAIFDASYIEFRIDDKIFFEGPMYFFPAGMGLAGVTAKTSESVFTNGSPIPAHTRRWGDYSKYIAPLQQFSLNIIFPGTPPTLAASADGGVGLDLNCIMDGLTDRAVQ